MDVLNHMERLQVLPQKLLTYVLNNWRDYIEWFRHIEDRDFVQKELVLATHMIMNTSAAGHCPRAYSRTVSLRPSMVGKVLHQPPSDSLTWSMIPYTAYAAPLAIAKSCILGAAFPIENDPISTQKNTCNIKW